MCINAYALIFFYKIYIYYLYGNKHGKKYFENLIIKASLESNIFSI